MNELLIGQKVKMQRRGENGSWMECGAGMIRDFTYGKAAHTPIFAITELFDSDNRKWTGVTEILPINASSFRLLAW